MAPLLIVLCSLLLDTLLNTQSVYGSEKFCWISRYHRDPSKILTLTYANIYFTRVCSNIHLVLAFLCPVFLIVGANLYFLFVAVVKIRAHSRDSLIVHKSRTASLSLYVRGKY